MSTPTKTVLLTALYFLGGFFASQTAFVLKDHGIVSLVWPSAGIALAAILLLGNKYWPGVALGAGLVAFLYITPGMFDQGPVGPFFFVLGTAIGNACGSILCAYLLIRFVDFQTSLSRVKDVAGLVLFASLLGTTIIAAFTALGLILAQGTFLEDTFWERFTASWLQWWIPNAMANLVVAPLLLSWGSKSIFRWTRRRALEALLCMAGLVAGTLVSFDSWLFYGIYSYPFAYLPYPFLVWAALRFGQQGATTGTAIISSLAIYSLLQRRGPFVMSNDTESFILLGSYIGILAVSNLLLAALATERERAEQAVRQSERRYRAVVEDQTEQIWRFLPNGTLTFVNEAYCRFTGKRREELLGQNFLPLLSPEDREIPLSYFASLSPENPVLTYDYRVTTADGNACWQQCTTRAIFDEENHICEFQTVAQDITARKKTEEELARARDAALESARIKSEFMANISHEIRTPMNGVIGMTELLLESPLNPEQKEYLETIRSSGDGLLAIINDILDFSKIGSGKFKFEVQDFNLRAIVESTIDLMADGAQSREIELVSMIDSDVVTALRGDPGRLRQVLSNLVSNAVKFTEQGEVVVMVSKEKEGPHKVQLRFEVKDTGIGISEEGQVHLFQAFYQADGSTTRKYGGTGLGLAISKRLVEMMQGEIGARSALGVGSTFWFTAWFEKQPPVQITPTTTLHSLEGIRAMVLDDNSTNCHLVHDLIVSRKMLNGMASRGEEALNLLLKEAQAGTPYDILLIDSSLTDMNWSKVVSVIRQEELLKSLQIVLMIPLRHGTEGDRMKFSGVNGYVFKPIKQAQLFEVLESVVNDRRGKTIPRPETKGRSLPPTAERVHLDSNAKILVAEDNLVNQKVAVSQLQRLGFQPDVVSNGAEAIQAMESKPYDIILMDCHMPELDGYAATAEIRRREGEDRKTVIIALTASVLAGDRERCMAAGMDDYIGKPVKTEHLQQVLSRWLSAIKQRSKVNN